MGQNDTSQTQYMRNPERFADAFNFKLFDGRRVVKPENLREMDSDELIIPYGKNGKLAAKDNVRRFRDVLKDLAVYNGDGREEHFVLGIEVQNKTHYAMPVRNGLYDFIQYSEQVKDAADRHLEHKDSSEFLSGFHKDDLLKGVVTITIHFSADSWNGPCTMHEMMDVHNPEFLQFIPDHNIFLIQPFDLSEDDLAKFQTDLGHVMRFIKFSKDKKKMRHLLEEDKNLMQIYKHLKTDAALVLNACAHLNIQINESEEETNMCEAWDEMAKDCRAEGKAEGIEEGLAMGRLQNLYELVWKDLLALNIAAKEAQQTEAEFKSGMDAYFAQLDYA